jgi:hypothetical protein
MPWYITIFDACNWNLRLHSYHDLVFFGDMIIFFFEYDMIDVVTGSWQFVQWLLCAEKKSLCNLCSYSLSYLWLLKDRLFPGVLVRPGETVKCDPGDVYCHVSQVCFM